jgi:hypothetical protein
MLLKSLSKDLPTRHDQCGMRQRDPTGDGESGMKRWIATGTAALALAATLAGAAACTATHAGAKASAPKKSAAVQAATNACEGGTYEWFNVMQTKVLTGASAAETLSKTGGKLKNKVERLYAPQTTVRATGPSPVPNAVLRSLADHIGGVVGTEAQVFAEAGRPAPAFDDDGAITVRKGGRFVQYAFATQVTADFRYSCSGGTAAIGHVTGWAGGGEGVLECSVAQPHATAVEAARLSCGVGSVAAKQA